MRERYSEETINKLARTALRFERQNRFEEALSIYYDLASEENEFAIERIPLVKYKEEQFKLRKVNLFVGIVSILAIMAAVLTIASSTINHILVTDSIAKEPNKTYLTKAFENEGFSNNIDEINIIYHKVKELDHTQMDSEFEIFVPKNITSSSLKNRVLEAIQTYSSEIKLEENNPAILLKTFKTDDTIGFVKCNLDNENTYEVFFI